MSLLDAILLNGGGGRSVTPPPNPGGTNFDNAIIICDGDSKTQGDNTTPWPTQLAASTPFNTNGATIHNFGVNGQHIGQLVPPEGMAMDAATQIDVLYTPGVENIVVAWEFTNQLAPGNITSQACVNLMRDYCLNRRAAGFKVIVCTDPHWNGASQGFNDQLTEVNDILRSTYAAFADGLADLDANVGLDPFATPGNFLDGLHPNTTGQTIAMGIIRTAILAL